MKEAEGNIRHQDDPKSKADRFVSYVIQKCANDRGFAAKMRRADNDATEYQSWFFLSHFVVALHDELERLPYAITAANIAKARIAENGTLPLGKCLRECYEKPSKVADSNIPGEARLRRILSCDTLPELCRVLRSTLALIHNKGCKLDFKLFLEQMLNFTSKAKSIKSGWVSDFYSIDTKRDGE